MRGLQQSKLVLTLASAAIGCGNTVTDPPLDTGPAVDGAADVATDTSGDASGQCNDLAPGGDWVAVTDQAGTAPTPAGGAITDGEYQWIAQHRFGGGTTKVTEGRYRLVYKGGTVQTVFEQKDGTVTRASAVYSTAGTALTVAATCGTGGGTSDYSATMSELRTFSRNGSTTLVMVYQRK